MKKTILTVFNKTALNHGDDKDNYRPRTTNGRGNSKESQWNYFRTPPQQPQLAVPKFKKGLGTSVHIVKITSYQKNKPTTRNIS